MDVDIGKVLPAGKGGKPKQVQVGDYQDAGLWYCGKCHTQKQTRLNFNGKETVVWCLCKCESEKREREKKEARQKEQARAIERLRHASLIPGKFQNVSFKDYKVRTENSKAYRIATGYVKSFRKNEKNNYGLLFYGPVGTGKSFTAACIANALLARNVSVVMTSFVKILQDIGPGSNNDEGIYISSLNKARLLIIDDLGAERNTDYAQEKVYNIIDSRVRANRPMVLTTNLRMRDMLECNDIRLKRIYDRIFETCLPVEVNGKSFRIEQAAIRQEAMRKYFAREGMQ